MQQTTLVVTGLQLSIAFLYMTSLVEGTDHHCVNNSPLNVIIDSDPEQSERVIPSTEFSSVPTSQLSCTWQISAAPTEHATLLVVLRAYKVPKPRRWRLVRSAYNVPKPRRLTRSASDDVPRMRYQLSLPTTASTSCSSHAISSVQTLESVGSFRVMPLPVGSILTVTYSQDRNQDGNPPPGLMLQLLHPGFCTRDLVSFDRRCHGKLEAKRSLTAELAFINGDSKTVQLAGFSSIDQIRQFVVASQLKFVGSGDLMRTKEPLNLTQPVRVGLFLDKTAGRLSYLSSGDGTCEMMEMRNQTAFPFTDLSTDPTHACGSLRVDEVSGREVIEFRNCDIPLPALISFAESPMPQCSNCSEPVASWISAVTAPDDARHPRDIRVTPLWMVVAISIAIVFVIAVISAAAHVAVFRKRLRFELPKSSGSWSTSDKKQDIGANASSPNSSLLKAKCIRPPDVSCEPTTILTSEPVYCKV